MPKQQSQEAVDVDFVVDNAISLSQFGLSSFVADYCLDPAVKSCGDNNRDRGKC